MLRRVMDQWLGLARSLVMYYGDPFKLRRMRRFYAQLIRPGDRCFDIGAHVGNRLWVWSQLGAQVVALEPQPSCMRFLQWRFGRRRGVTLIEAAVGSAPGEASLWISTRTPTVTTLSQEWIRAVRQADAFATVAWSQRVTVPVLTLDQLIEDYGIPAFCKIDVEGYELEVLRGLSQPLPLLSFEYVPATKELALACMAHLQRVGNYTYNWSVGESHRWQGQEWLTATAMCAALDRLQVNDTSGDIYARLIE